MKAPVKPTTLSNVLRSPTKTHGVTRTRFHDDAEEDQMMKTAAPARSRRENHRRNSPDVGVGSNPRSAAGGEESRVGGYPPVRVLVIFEGEYRAYGDAIAGAIGDLRPRVEVAVAETTDLRAEVARVSPHLVISSQPKAADPARTLAWVELPHEPGLAGQICFGGQRLEAYDLALGDLLEVVDRTESMVPGPNSTRGRPK